MCSSGDGFPHNGQRIPILLSAEWATMMQEIINFRNMSSEIVRILALVHIRTVLKLMAQAVRL